MTETDDKQAKLQRWLDLVSDLPDLPHGLLALPFLPWALPPTRHSGEPLTGPWSCPHGHAWATWVVEKAQVYRAVGDGAATLQEEPRALSVWWYPNKLTTIVCWDPSKKTDSVLDRFDLVPIPSWEADELYGWVVGHYDNLPEKGAGDGNAIRDEEGNDDEEGPAEEGDGQEQEG